MLRCTSLVGPSVYATQPSGGADPHRYLLGTGSAALFPSYLPSNSSAGTWQQRAKSASISTTARASLHAPLSSAPQPIGTAAHHRSPRRACTLMLQAAATVHCTTACSCADALRLVQAAGSVTFPVNLVLSPGQHVRAAPHLPRIARLRTRNPARHRCARGIVFSSAPPTPTPNPQPSSFPALLPDACALPCRADHGTVP